jgi:hypothetical protein
VKDACYNDNITYPIAMLDTTYADTIKREDIPGSELNATFIGGWNGDSIYFFIDVNDDTLNSATADSYANDSVELYFDGANSKSSSLDIIDDVQVRMEWDDPGGNADVDGGCVLTPVIAAMNYISVAKDALDGYIVEVAFQIEVLQLAAAGTEFGFEAQVNENDNFGRAGLLRWHDQANEGWHDFRVLGNAQMTAGANNISEPNDKYYLQNQQSRES